jgi:hypothetical protein
LQAGQKPGLEAVVKDTLLAQVICFMLSNKSQMKRFQLDFDAEVYENIAKQLKK